YFMTVSFAAVLYVAAPVAFVSTGGTSLFPDKVALNFAANTFVLIVDIVPSSNVEDMAARITIVYEF
ncbi:MAG: hypothetical protein WBP74_07350, partial [Nitrososphaeraceae archaeon]